MALKGRMAITLELNSPAPTTVHHQAKLLGEQAVRDWRRHLILQRVGCLKGLLILKEFCSKPIQRVLGKSTLYSDPSQIGNPTWVRTLLRQIECLIASGYYGTFNAVNRGAASRLEYVQEIVKAFELNVKVEKAPENMFVRIAPVSKNESALNQSLELLGLNLFGPWQDDLREYIKDIRPSISKISESL